jgi:UDP-N-acetylglucosamine 3-dehydrogenase
VEWKSGQLSFECIQNPAYSATKIHSNYTNIAVEALVLRKTHTLRYPEMSIKPAKLKIGLIGCGKVAIEHHLPSLKRLARANLVAVADVQCESLDRLTKNYPAVTRYNSARDLLDDPRIEAVGVLTPTSSHHEISLAALDAGKHVFLEKPLALSRKECDELAAAGRKSKLKTMVCFNLRWHRLILQAKEILSSGRLGFIVAIRSAYTHWVGRHRTGTGGYALAAG